MKILMVNKFLYPRGGSESYMLKLGEELENQGHQVEYFGMYDEKNTVGNSEISSAAGGEESRVKATGRGFDRIGGENASAERAGKYL